MLINQHIGYDSELGQGVDGSLFQQELIELDGMGKKRIEVWINSVGGSVMNGYNIASGILGTKTPVDTVCVGMAASIAGVIFQCGRKRIMADYGILMYHNPYGKEDGTTPLTETMKASLNTIISNRSGMNSVAVQAMMDRTTFIEASEAVALKLCDEIQSTINLNTKYAPRPASIADGRNFMAEINNVVNTFLKINTSDMTEVNAKLNLPATAGEPERLNAITEIQNSVQTLTQQVGQKDATITDLNNKLTAEQGKVTGLSAKVTELTTAADQANTAKNAAELEVKTLKAKSLAAELVAAGKVKNTAEAIAEVEKKATEDYDGTKALFENVAGVKNAAQIQTGGDPSKNQPVGQVLVSTTMLQIQAKLRGK